MQNASKNADVCRGEISTQNATITGALCRPVGNYVGVCSQEN